MVLAVRGVMDAAINFGSTRRGPSVLSSHTPVPTRSLAKFTLKKSQCAVSSGGLSFSRSASVLSHESKTRRSISTHATTVDTHTGMALMQGLRDDMEDYAVVIPSDEGYVFGGKCPGNNVGQMV
eukprot:9149640-Pyramimonas_sp.AAC.2